MLASDKIERLEAIITQSDSAVLSLRSELQGTQVRVLQAQALLGNWTGKIEGFESETVSASAVIAHLHDQIRELQHQVALKDSEKHAMEARLYVMQDIRVEGQAQLEKIKHGLANDRQEIASLKEKNGLLVQQISEMQQVDASKERLLALMQTAADTNEEQIQSMTEQLTTMKSVHHQVELFFGEMESACIVAEKLCKALSDTSTDHAFLQGVVARLEGEYEEEQKLSAMLQTQVQTLHAVVLQHEELKKN